MYLLPRGSNQKLLHLAALLLHTGCVCGVGFVMQAILLPGLCRIAQAVTTARTGMLWLNPGEFRRVLGA